MRKIVIGCVLSAALVMPLEAAAKPNSTDVRNASQECRAERGTTAASREAFRAKYGTNQNGRNAFGRCVSQTSREEEQQREESRENAAKECKAERGNTPESRAAFAEKYGTNRNNRNAFGRCVSQNAQENKEEQDAEDAEEAEARQNAAQRCDAERGETEASRAAFAEKYGTNRNNRNAFGRCVSKLAQQQEATPAS